MFKVIPLSLGIWLLTCATGAVADVPSVQCTNKNDAIPASTANFQNNGDGTVSDTNTGLMWKMCSEGQNVNVTFDGCESIAWTSSWYGALYDVNSVNAGVIGTENFSHTDWRLPNTKELASIIEAQCWDPSVNEFVFPASPSYWYWSSSPSLLTNAGYRAWGVHLGAGTSSTASKHLGFHVRLVRDE